MPERDGEYRLLIDQLVRAVQEGQGQIGAKRARSGLWNVNADAYDASDPLWSTQRQYNELLARLATEDREVLATLLEETFVAGVHETLVVLHQMEVVPFDAGYEGTPFHDFIGRLNGWSWPDAGDATEPKADA